MELRNLRTFHAITTTGNFARAASALGYTQSTVTVHIQQLEHDLGVKLFEKSGRNMILTDKGEEVLEIATHLLALADHLEEACQEENDLKGTLKIAAAETILCYLLEPVIREFRQSAPNVSLKVLAKTCAQTPEALKDGSCDLGFTYCEPRDQKHFSTLPICSVSLIPVAAPEYASIDLATANQTIALPLILDEPDSVIRNLFEDYLKEKNIAYEGTIEMWSTQAIKCCVAAGMGFTILPKFAVQREIAEGQLCPLCWKPSSNSVSIFYARKSTHRISRAMQLFSEIAYHHLGASEIVRTHP